MGRWLTRRENSAGDLRLYGSDLGLGLVTLFKFGHLLALHRWCRDFLAEDDISDFAGGQGGNINAIPFAKILQVW